MQLQGRIAQGLSMSSWVRKGMFRVSEMGGRLINTINATSRILYFPAVRGAGQTYFLVSVYLPSSCPIVGVFRTQQVATADAGTSAPLVMSCAKGLFQSPSDVAGASGPRG
jgi:hypothetical protein